MKELLLQNSHAGKMSFEKTVCEDLLSNILISQQGNGAGFVGNELSVEYLKGSSRGKVFLLQNITSFAFRL